MCVNKSNNNEIHYPLLAAVGFKIQAWYDLDNMCMEKFAEKYVQFMSVS